MNAITPENELLDALWVPSQHMTDEHLFFDELRVGYLEQFNEHTFYGNACHERTGPLGRRSCETPMTMQEARRIVINRAVAKLLSICPPDPALIGTKPLVLYFATDADRDSMLAVCAEAFPGMVWRKI